MNCTYLYRGKRALTMMYINNVEGKGKFVPVLN